jgi:hypothetical protein
MKTSTIAATLALALTMSGCLPVLVGSAIVSSGNKSSSTTQARQRFLSELQKNNTEREKNGLKPLNVCVEMYNFDQDWALDHPECKAVIDSLNAQNSGYPK